MEYYSTSTAKTLDATFEGGPGDRPTPGDDALLSSRTILLATDQDSLAESLRLNYGASLVSVGHTDAPFFALARRVEIGGVHLHYCRYDTPVEIQFHDMAGIRQMLCLSGQGRFSSAGQQVDIDLDNTTIIPPGASFLASYGASYKQLVTQFDEGALRLKAEAIIGHSLPGPLNVRTLEALPTAPRLRSQEIARTLARILAADTPIDRPIVEMGQALSSAFLFENVAGFAERFTDEPRSASVANVRVLEEYIHANWNRPLTVEEIAVACSVSVRSVFSRFKQHLGTAPLTYLRDLRLDHAHQRLLDGGEDSVISIALSCGFSSFGHFARRYRERFGELPSTTLARRPRV
ncbi:AraC family transcriptional regulator [Caulobacter sp. ErkDOM-E]|uniref:helix-turn-helix transcriptional regulator n=1 Tax=Caulobacter sp. ErkDOM-E TaxID=3402778 RepID=UPI003AF764D5